MSCKPKFPKPNKEITGDFCKCTFPLSTINTIFNEFLFDVKEKKFKTIKVTNDILIEKIIFPKGNMSFEEIRKIAKRTGNIKRKIFVDDKLEKTSKINFNV